MEETTNNTDTKMADTKMADTYNIDPAEAILIRVFEEGDHWATDASNGLDGDTLKYTDNIWTHFDDKPLTKTAAIEHARDFAREIGRNDLADAVYVEDEDGPEQWVRHRYGN